MAVVVEVERGKVLIIFTYLFIVAIVLRDVYCGWIRRRRNMCYRIDGVL